MSTRSLPVRVRIHKVFRRIRCELRLTWGRLRNPGASPKPRRPLKAVVAAPVPALGLREEAHELLDHFADAQLPEVVRELERLYGEEPDGVEMERARSGSE